MRILCPFCGERDLVEFTVLGAADPARPSVDVADLDGEAAREAFAGAVYLRDNPAGPQREHWFHGYGCGSWLVVTRDTATHAILDVALADGAAA